jgi:hypothetical protein
MGAKKKSTPAQTSGLSVAANTSSLGPSSDRIVAMTVCDGVDTPLSELFSERRSRIVREAETLLMAANDEDLASRAVLAEAAEVLRQLSQPNRPQPFRRVQAALTVWSAILPGRIVNEEFGDYMEDIHCRIAKGQRWCVYLRVCAAIFWTGLNAIGYAMKAVGKKSAG